jgi:hypothetical protein
MLVFGAIQFKSSNDGGMEIIHNDCHQYLSQEEVFELSNYISWITQRVYVTNRRYDNPLQADVANVAPNNF